MTDITATANDIVEFVVAHGFSTPSRMYVEATLQALLVAPVAEAPATPEAPVETDGVAITTVEFAGTTYALDSTEAVPTAPKRPKKAAEDVIAEQATDAANG